MIEMSGGTCMRETRFYFLMKTHIIRRQRAAIVSGRTLRENLLSCCAVPPEHPGDNGGSLLFIRTLRAAGIRKASHSYADYERGKAILRKMPATFYHAGIRILAEYVKV